jgi:hypothetical protein
MRPIDKSARDARRAVAERFRVFIQTLMSQFTTAPAELFKRAEDAHGIGDSPEKKSSAGAR